MLSLRKTNDEIFRMIDGHKFKKCHFELNKMFLEQFENWKSKFR